MQQNASRDRWTFEYTEQRLDRDHDRRSTDLCFETAEEYDAPGDYATGANIAGMCRVGSAMTALGVV
ncbi:MAG: hypothetical protein U5R31_07690 [Acidimicrobiia bacterium]|nr:hypothetical protein [Acidimicrobiia bacterium]